MDISLWKAVLLGVVQGLTEFLPISSSGHLVLAERWLGVSELPLTFDIIIHLGTLSALLFFFRWQLIRLSGKYFQQIILATIPILLFGVLFRPYFDHVAGGLVLSFNFLISAFFMFVADRLLKQEDATDGFGRFWQKVSDQLMTLAKQAKIQNTVSSPGSIQSLSIGIFQALAILPGVSRSGSTLFGGILVGLNRSQAFEFAFIISIPAVLGANSLAVIELLGSTATASLPLTFTLIATIASALSGFIALRLLEYTIKHSKLAFFAWYLIAVSIASVLFV